MNAPRGTGAFLEGIVEGGGDGDANGCCWSRESVVSKWKPPRGFHVTRIEQGAISDFSCSGDSTALPENKRPDLERPS